MFDKCERFREAFSQQGRIGARKLNPPWPGALARAQMSFSLSEKPNARRPSPRPSPSGRGWKSKRLFSFAFCEEMSKSWESFSVKGRICARKLNPPWPGALARAQMSFSLSEKPNARRPSPRPSPSGRGWKSKRLFSFAFCEEMSNSWESFSVKGRIGARKLNTLRKNRARIMPARAQVSVSSSGPTRHQQPAVIDRTHPRLAMRGYWPTLDGDISPASPIAKGLMPRALCSIISTADEGEHR